ncbi:MAG: LuxR C-terminal-related transcriptional regulator [Bacteroidales bacterium]|nr:LuxR C-terminal-related transcriptional regulator [Bacteroidales bacterium]
MIKDGCTPRIAILSVDTASAVGLRQLLRQYHDVKAEIVENVQDLVSYSSVLIDSESLVAQVDSLCSFRDKLTLFGRGKPLDTTLNESELIDALGALVERVQQRAEEDCSQALSQREVEVLRCVAQGYTNKETADHLNISINTVLTHRRNIQAKLGIRSTSALSVYAAINGLIT